MIQGQNSALMLKEREEEEKAGTNIRRWSERLVNDQVDNQGETTLWGFWNSTSLPCIKIKCVRDKKGLSVTACQSRMNIKIVFGNSREEGDFYDVTLACEDGE